MQRLSTRIVNIEHKTEQGLRQMLLEHKKKQGLFDFKNEAFIIKQKIKENKERELEAK